jgi:hypothetical protein
MILRVASRHKKPRRDGGAKFACSTAIPIGRITAKLTAPSRRGKSSTTGASLIPLVARANEYENGSGTIARAVEQGQIIPLR